MDGEYLWLKSKVNDERIQTANYFVVPLLQMPPHVLSTPSAISNDPRPTKLWSAGAIPSHYSHQMNVYLHCRGAAYVLALWKAGNLIL